MSIEFSYKDPENLDFILKEMNNIKDLDGILNMINTIYPDWIVYILNDYSEDYPHLIKNWNTIVSTSNIKKGKIIVVRFMSDKEDHKLIRIFADLFTTSGSVLRTINDLLPCSQCASAIPSEYVYNKMKEHKIRTLPEKWSEKCAKCQ
jgi:hypothetical protein